ncbi:ABC-2 transporter permease [Streptomyces paludis]|uniref:ABC transporter permease n=1 Tax=Streptomyces paludis TaxID=2282738 RepID=A0A345HPT0_9ACTN|nr:ABC transporter permease [Streptomyces paludis]AXG78704.1 ABC transporter permease [Streptomyces paludis]
MSALTLRGPHWVTGRLHRRALWMALVFLVLVTGVTLYMWWRTAAAYTDFTATGCPLNGDSGACAQPSRDYSNIERHFDEWLRYVDLTLPILPAVVGSFVAGPVIARELEHGTYRLAWTQSVSPARWLLSRLALPTAWTVLLTALFTVLFRVAWAQGPHHVYRGYWYDDFYYYGLGPVLMGYVLLAIAVGALVAVLIRGTVAAMAVTSAAVVTVFLAFGIKLRGLLMPTLQTAADEQVPENSWVVSWNDVPMPDKPDTFYSPGTTGTLVDYHPASHFWPLQFIETGILLALAALAAYGAFRALRRLHA